MAQPKQTSLREIDFSYYFKHYMLLLWRWKLWIIISGPVVSLFALIYMVKFAPPVPELRATALIGIEHDVNTGAAMMNFVDIDNSKAELITTRNFLYDIVNKLSLQLRIAKYPRNTVFKSVVVDSTAKMGKYVLALDKENNGTYTITYSERGIKATKTAIARGKIKELEVIKLPGVLLEFSSEYRKEPYVITFYIVEMHKAIESLHKGLTIERPDFRRQINYIEVSLRGRDYHMVATILNTIADAFVYKKLMFKKRKTINVLDALEKQFKKAKGELAIAESRLRNFRTRNPTVGLTQSAEQTVNNMIEMETNTFSIKNSIKEAKVLQTKYSQAATEDKAQTAEATLLFLNAQNNTTSPVLQEELTRLLTEQRSLQQNHASNHPSVLKNQEEISKILDKTQIALSNYITNTDDKLSEQTSEVRSMSQRLQRLPTKELQLAKLRRQHQVNAEIYSTVLDRYNTAKVAETVEVADTYVMDYAVPPIPPPTNKVRILGICLLLGLAIALGPPVISDLIRKTARTEFDLKKMSNMLVLESIPHIITSEKSNLESETRQAKLITSEYKHEFIKEIFRSLRTKLEMGLYEYSDKNIVITSLDAGVGKSTIASNIAISLALQGTKTLLIDGDLRRGTINTLFDLSQSPGLSELLISEDNVTEDFINQYIQRTKIANLSIIPSGEFVSYSSDLLTSRRFPEVKNLVSQNFDIIIVDTPPLGSLTDAVVIHEFFSKYIIIVKAGVSNIIDLKKKIKEYPAIINKIMGLVLNYAFIDKIRSYYKNSKYY